MSILICGSMAYDNIMVFQGRFREHILPDRIHMLNVSFLVPTLRRNFGGCAANIAYNLKLLGGEGYAMATVGHDFAPYEARLREFGISLKYVRQVDSEFTAQAYITTDLDDNQITAFHPGAMNHSHVNTVPTDGSIRIGVVSPDGRQGMMEHARQFAVANIPFMFDPGQGLPMFDGEELKHFIDQASWVTVNDYEAQLLSERTGLSAKDIARHIGQKRGSGAVVVTRGGEGSSIYVHGQGHERCIEIPCVKAANTVDPTGCGDAYRAGLLFGLARNLGWETSGRIASLIGAIKIESAGPQSHHFTLAQFQQRYRESFGQNLNV